MFPINLNSWRHETLMDTEFSVALWNSKSKILKFAFCLFLFPVHDETEKLCVNVVYVLLPAAH